MQHNSRKKFLGQARDCAGGLWNIVESRPTEYDWPVLLGYPAGFRQKGGCQVIPTQEVRDYLEQYRMAREMVRLPISDGAVHHLRNQLGMNYIRDRKQWWRQVKHELFHPEQPPKPALLDTDRLTPHGAWPKTELRRMVELAEEGKGDKEIAKILGRSEKTVGLFCRRLFGPRKPMHAWSTEEKNNLAELKKQGHSLREIAAILGRTAKSVRPIYVQTPPKQQPPRRWTQEERQKLIELTEANRSVEEIMESLGRTREAVIVTQRKIAGVHARKSTPKTGREYMDWTEEEDQKLKELALAGHSADELARIMGRTRASVQMRCQRVLELKYSRKQARYYQPD